MKNNTLLKNIIELKKEITVVILILLFSLSIFTIGWVIYRFFFWEPFVDPFVINISNLAQ